MLYIVLAFVLYSVICDGSQPVDGYGNVGKCTISILFPYFCYSDQSLETPFIYIHSYFFKIIKMLANRSHRVGMKSCKHLSCTE